jgi:hypothetical protein
MQDASRELVGKDACRFIFLPPTPSKTKLGMTVYRQTRGANNAAIDPIRKSDHKKREPEQLHAGKKEATNSYQGVAKT